MFCSFFSIGGGGGTQFVDGRSRMTVDPRIPTMPGWSTSDFHQPGRHFLHQARSAVRCSASRMKGELHPSKNRRKTDVGTLCFTWLWMTALISYFFFWCGHSRDSNDFWVGGVGINAFWRTPSPTLFNPSSNLFSAWVQRYWSW